MMAYAYAANDTISRAPVDGGIEITSEQYDAARAAKLAGREALVIDGELVIRDPQPAPDYVWTSGEWVAPEPEPPTTEELWAALRAERDGRLLSSDYTQLPDVPDGGTKAAWATYRQALRDLPANTTDPDAPVWPVAPT